MKILKYKLARSYKDKSVHDLLESGEIDKGDLVVYASKSGKRITTTYMNYNAGLCDCCCSIYSWPNRFEVYRPTEEKKK